MRRFVPILMVMTGLSACGRTTPLVADSRPAFDPVAFFDGQIRFRGYIEDGSGAPVEPIMTDSHASIDDEHRPHIGADADSPRRQDATTHLALWQTGTGQFEATANDMIGYATGRGGGGVFHCQWILELSAAGGLVSGSPPGRRWPPSVRSPGVGGCSVKHADNGKLRISTIFDSLHRCYR